MRPAALLAASAALLLQTAAAWRWELNTYDDPAKCTGLLNRPDFSDNGNYDKPCQKTHRRDQDYQVNISRDAPSACTVALYADDACSDGALVAAHSGLRSGGQCLVVPGPDAVRSYRAEGCQHPAAGHAPGQPMRFWR